MESIILTLYLRGCVSPAVGIKQSLLGASMKRYDFIWSDARKMFIYGETDITSDTEGMARLVSDLDDMCAGLKGPSQFSPYQPAIKFHGITDRMEAITCEPPVQVLCKTRGLSLHGMVAEGLVGNGARGEIQVADVEWFIAHPPK